LSPEIKIALYLCFVFSLFFFGSLKFYAFALVLVLLSLSRIPWRNVKAGWIPLFLFLLFTFAGNSINHPGKILFAAGPLVITDEGLHLALLRTARIFLMVAGVKIIMATTGPEALLAGLSRLLMPFERFGVPMKDFFHTMGLTLKCFPVLKEAIRTRYRETAESIEMDGLWLKAKMTALFLLPLFVESIRTPEKFFEKEEGHGQER
jgi:energy-coupling factor transport system permease protein